MSARRRWLQFRLSTVLWVITALATCMAIVARRPKPALPIITLNSGDAWPDTSRAGESTARGWSKRVTIPPHGECLVSIDAAKPGELFPEDFLKIVVRSIAGVPLAECEFSSSYGSAELDVIDLDADRNPEFVLIKGTGRGTSARYETLTVLTVNGSTFHERMTSPYSAFVGPANPWRYQRQYERTAGGVVEILLTLDQPRADPFWPVDPEWVPPDAVRILGLRRR